MKTHMLGTTDGLTACGLPLTEIEHLATLDLTQVDCGVCWAPLLRETREERGLSRREVAVNTGLTQSVVWRAEQTDRYTEPQERTAIWMFLQTAPAKVKQSKVKKSDTALQDALARVDRLTDTLTYVLAELDGMITVKKLAKQGAGSLIKLRDEITEKMTDEAFKKLEEETK